MERNKKPASRWLVYQVLCAIREHGEVDAETLAEIFRTDKKRIWRAIAQLKERELIYSYLRGIYRVTEKGKAPEHC